MHEAFVEATVGIEPTVELLQSSALPLGYIAVSGNILEKGAKGKGALVLHPIFR